MYMTDNIFGILTESQFFLNYIVKWWSQITIPLIIRDKDYKLGKAN